MLVLLLFLASVTLIYIELFLPGGVFGILGLIAFAASIVLAFYYYQAAGFWILLAEIVAGTILLLLGLRRFPTSYAGKLLILKHNLDKKEGFAGTESLEEYMGKEGVSLTKLRPAGIADIASVRLDVVSDGTFIEKGRKVQVVRVEGNRVVVRELKSATQKQEEN